MPSVPVERVQLGIRMEKRLVKVLKGLAEFEDLTLGQLLEKIVLHSFEPVEGHEGEFSASPHGPRALAAAADLRRVYGMDYDLHGFRDFDEPELRCRMGGVGRRQPWQRPSARRVTSSASVTAASVTLR
jgi:hypothetical protein